MALHNKISRKELKARVEMDPTPRITLSFYRYFKIEDPKAFRDQLYETLAGFDVFGRIYLATEGINAQVSLPMANYEPFRDYLYSIPLLGGMHLNRAFDDDGKSFFVLDIKVRYKIVADGINDPSFSMVQKGKYVDAQQMNELMKDPKTIVIDMRNHYEFEVGHFQNAIEVPSDTFREQLPKVAEMMKDQREKNIVMYCTGGIRCEKASAYMLHQGYKHVFHLEGGIINYARQVKDAGMESRFIGKNFVFDQRLGERITDDVIAHCHQCGQPADTHTNCRSEACHLLFIQCAACAEKFEGCCSQECLDFTRLPEQQRKELRKGTDKGRNVFNKARSRKGLKPGN